MPALMSDYHHSTAAWRGEFRTHLSVVEVGVLPPSFEINLDSNASSTN